MFWLLVTLISVFGLSVIGNLRKVGIAPKHYPAGHAVDAAGGAALLVVLVYALLRWV